jgi:hypothetical protein
MGPNPDGARYVPTVTTRIDWQIESSRIETLARTRPSIRRNSDFGSRRRRDPDAAAARRIVVGTRPGPSNLDRPRYVSDYPRWVTEGRRPPRRRGALPKTSEIAKESTPARLVGLLRCELPAAANWTDTESTVRSSIKEIWMITILLVILLLMLVGAVPAWPHSRGWGYAPSGTLGLVLLILLVLVLTGRL